MGVGVSVAGIGVNVGVAGIRVLGVIGSSSRGVTVGVGTIVTNTNVVAAGVTVTIGTLVGASV